jgi:hypothetical protein
MNDAAAASPIIGLAWFLPGMGFKTVASDSKVCCEELVGLDVDMIAGSVISFDVLRTRLDWDPAPLPTIIAIVAEG